MYRIKNKADWREFSSDVNRRANADEALRFGLSQNGDDVDGYFDTMNGYSGDLYFNGGARWQTPAEFIDGVEGNYSYPFYVVDTGSNYSWL